MAHQVESMMSVAKKPWHGLGVIVNEAPTAARAMELAGLNWSVTLERLSFGNAAGGRTEVDRFAVVRSTDGKVVGDAVSPRYTPLQNSTAFEFFDPFTANGLASYETAGSLQEGRRVWVLAKLNRPNAEIVPGDAVEKYLLLSNSHDGTLAVRVAFTPIRVVCANTLALAHNTGRAENRFLRVRHTKSVEIGLDAIQDAVNLADQSFEATADQYRELARRGVYPSDLRKFVKHVFQLPDADKDLTAQGKKTIADILARHEQNCSIVGDLLASDRHNREFVQRAETNLLDSIVEGMQTGRGQAELSTAVRSSWWSAYNSVTEHLTHERGRTGDSRLNSLWFGDSANVNARALDSALTMSA